MMFSAMAEWIQIMRFITGTQYTWILSSYTTVTSETVKLNFFHPLSFDHFGLPASLKWAGVTLFGWINKANCLEECHPHSQLTQHDLFIQHCSHIALWASDGRPRCAARRVIATQDREIGKPVSRERGKKKKTGATETEDCVSHCAECWAKI